MESQQVEDKLDHGYRPSVADRELLRSGAELMSIDQCQTIRELDDSQLVGGHAGAAAAGADVAVKEDVRMLDVVVNSEPKVAEVSSLKRKRGRPPRIQGKVGKQPPLPPQRMKKDEEDVCFICFDGGSLVLCDRRGCPKAYHPSCIKRDEAFFRSKAKWNCGWHICSSCQKASHYMCYTCTYSLCKGCTKDADYVCVRANKGFCGTCMRTIMLIENVSLGSTEKVQVDFDDKTSWEYLFKVYWIYLKAKLSLTLDELTKAKNPWKGEELAKAKNSWKGAFSLTPKVNSSGEICHVSENCCKNTEANQSKRRKTRNQSILQHQNLVGGEHSGVSEVTLSVDGTMWATKELLEFVAHVKNGDTSILSQFDVQSLLLEYIKRNNLRDPHQKSQIICDRLLINLFGKVRVGHFEMLKLLEYHFLVKEKTLAGDAARAGVNDSVGSQVEASGNNGDQMTMGNDRRRKTRKKTDETGLQNNYNQDDYAAIDSYNINLLYLKRSLMESLMDDAEKFHEKIVGSFVRIRIPGGDQKQDMYRLVQVIGTSKVVESYKVGTRTTDVMLEILNLDKKELVSIDGISNQDFSEDECRRLRQSIKCGLIKRLTVGEIQTKAMTLQAVKVSDGLEAEVLRLNHLRDRASEKGHRKELRECVEKLELLKSPAELQRRLLEVAHVHTDSNMDPSFDSDEDSEKKQGNYLGPANPGFGRTNAKVNSVLKGGDGLNNLGNCEQSDLDITCNQSQDKITTVYADRDGITLVHERVYDTGTQVGEPFDLNDENGQKNLAVPVGSMTADSCTQGAVSSQLLSGVASPVLPASSAARELSASDVETDKLWHYEDPSGKIQGPFSMMQLRKWSTSGLFPFDLRVWRINEKQGNSVLLTDALVRRFHHDQSLPSRGYLQLQETVVASKDMDKTSEGSIQTADAKFVGNKDVDQSLKSVQNDGVHCNGKDETMKNERYFHSSSWTTLVDVAVSNHGLTQGSSNDWETSKSSKSWSSEPQMCRSIPSPSTSGQRCETSSPQVRDHHLDEKLTSSPSNVNEHSLKTSENQPSLRESNEKRAESDSYSSLSSGQSWRPPPIKDSSGWDSNSGFISADKCIKTSDLNKEIHFSDLPNSSPKGNHEGLEIQPAGNKLSVSSSVPVLDSGPSWSTASSLVVGGAQVSEVASEWGGSITPSKSSTKEWDSNLVSASSLKPTEGAGGHTATPTPENDHLTHSPPTHPVIDVSSWQQIEHNEFCSLADESVSDLLAEVEAMESLGGLPSPTSKMRCEDLAQGSDNDCFSPVEGFCPTPEPGKSDALSSTGDIPMSSQLTVADDALHLCHMLPQSIVTNGLCQMPSQLRVTDQQLVLSHIPSRSTATADFLGASQMPSPSTSTDEPPQVLHTDILKPKTSFSTHSCSTTELEGDRKLSELSVNQWETGSGRQPPIASTAKRETGTKIQPSIASIVGQWGSSSDIQHSVSSTTNASWGTMKGNINVRQGVAQGNTETNWGTTGHGTTQQHIDVNTATSVGNSSSWGNQPRYGGDRFSGPREHRNYFQGRDSVFGRDRSWNKQPSYGVGNGGGSHRHPPKGQRVCKFYESGYCKKGASCSYWHPL